LKSEKSPYLLQHAQNPVDWYPWGDEAFDKARQEDKPIFLSIGYSTCHWCHVMERESFEDEEIAKLLNETFINIKVDREERPDIDAVYMKVCQFMTRSGGWPLTIMMTPDKEAFFAATYVPKKRKYNMLGLAEMIPEVQELWRDKREEVLTAASEVTQALRRKPSNKEEDIGEDILHRAYQSLSLSYDKTYGGFEKTPKFPSPHNFSFLLRYWKRTGDKNALRMVEHTISEMRRGGIYDQIGLGFHRYSTDEKWIVPHFEKMLYDQAMMALAALELFQATGEKVYETIVREIFSYVSQELTDERGGFYCAQDADSEGEEGKFYLWTEKDIREVLSEKEADLFLSLYRHDDDSSVPGMQDIPAGHFIPHLKTSNAGGPELLELLPRMESIRKRLYAARKKRIHPHKDDKILTDWNGLMIAAFARGANVLDDPAYKQIAVKAFEFIMEFLQDGESRLLHRYRDGQASVAGNIDDYAFVIWALLELYETTFDARYIVKALEYQACLYAFFRDERDGGYFFTPVDAERLLTRPKELYDGAIPSGNSVAFLSALKLSRITGDADLDEKAHEVYRAFCAHVEAMPTAFTQFLCGLDFAIGPASEVIITGLDGRSDTKALLHALREYFVPNKVVVFRPDDRDDHDIETLMPYAASHSAINGQATAYVCRNFTCALPTNDPKKMMELLDEK